MAANTQLNLVFSNPISMEIADFANGIYGSIETNICLKTFWVDCTDIS